MEYCSKCGENLKGNGEIYVMNSDGTVQKSLSDSKYNDIASSLVIITLLNIIAKKRGE